MGTRNSNILRQFYVILYNYSIITSIELIKWKIYHKIKTESKFLCRK